MTTDNDLIRKLIEEVIKRSLAAFQNVKAEKKKDSTVVTRLDREISDLIRESFRSEFPERGFISEEEPRPYLPEAPLQWVLDPLDGTASFVRGHPVWGVGLGLMENLNPIEGYISFPVLGEDLTFKDDEMKINGRQFESPPEQVLEDTLNVLISSKLQGFLHLERLEKYKLRNFGSNIYHIAAVALGRSEAAITQRCYIWDILPALPFSRFRGCVEFYLDGHPFSLEDMFAENPNQPRLKAPIIIGQPRHVEDLLNLLA